MGVFFFWGGGGGGGGLKFEEFGGLEASPLRNGTLKRRGRERESDLLGDNLNSL